MRASRIVERQWREVFTHLITNLMVAESTLPMTERLEEAEFQDPVDNATAEQVETQQPLSTALFT
jgi:hypothetical protein